MMLRLALPALFALATPLAALELDAMTDAERNAFRAEVRAYLLDNPEVLQEAIAVLRLREHEAQVSQDTALVQTHAEAIFNDGHSYVGGNPDGDVTIVEFLDYRCGYCKRAFPEVEALIAGDGNIRFVVKEYPILGEASVIAARYAIATKFVAGEEAYKNVHDTLMEYSGDITPQSLGRLAGALDLDHDAISAEMDSDRVTAVIAENRALGDLMQISGTPTFIFQDQMVRGYVDSASMEALLADIRGE